MRGIPKIARWQRETLNFAFAGEQRGRSVGVGGRPCNYFSEWSERTPSRPGPTCGYAGVGSGGRKYKFLRDVGNESDIKTRGTKHHNDQSELLKALNREDDPFKDWTEKIHKEVLECMADPFSERDKKKKNRPKKNYENCVTDLLKLIRHIGEHFKEKGDEVKEIIKDPADYFLDHFPNLTIYVYRNLYDTQYSKHFPHTENYSHF
ncbi:2-5A-dependent ribonuclease [Varanus komodoensis]|nr:2-5A-dependent ribonuclease [Varanus komodoensis]